MSDPTQPAFHSLGTVYGEVCQRWVVVYSPPAYQRAWKTVHKSCLQQSTTDCKAFEKLCQYEFACGECLDIDQER